MIIVMKEVKHSFEFEGKVLEHVKNYTCLGTIIMEHETTDRGINELI